MKVRINVGSPYDVVISRGILNNIGSEALKYLEPSNALIVTDDIVDSHYGKICEESLKQSGFNVNKFVFKNLKNKE